MSLSPAHASDAYDSVEREFASPELGQALSELSDAHRERLRQYWIDRASGELTTALTFEFMLDDLRLEHVPDTLCEMAEQAILDEHRHVEWCLRWAKRVDSSQPAEAKLGGTRPLTFDGASDHDNRLLRTVFGCCFSETAAVHILRASHARIGIASVRRLNHLHLKEEIRHARLGWALLGWPGITERDRAMLRERVPELVQITRLVWQSTRRAPDDKLHGFGFLSSEIVDAAVDEALSDVVLPGLAHLGV